MSARRGGGADIAAAFFSAFTAARLRQGRIPLSMAAWPRPVFGALPGSGDLRPFVAGLLEGVTVVVVRGWRT